MDEGLLHFDKPTDISMFTQQINLQLSRHTGIPHQKNMPGLLAIVAILLILIRFIIAFVLIRASLVGR
jgi:hypothetical protein